jgi:hypothetical protein
VKNSNDEKNLTKKQEEKFLHVSLGLGDSWKVDLNFSLKIRTGENALQEQSQPCSITFHEY